MNFLRSAREYMTPVLQASQYLEKGVLTPEEFVAAGDLLVMKCPTWAWASGDAKKVKAYLPSDKQYLVTKGAPCMQRVSALELAYVGKNGKRGNGGTEGAWPTGAREASCAGCSGVCCGVCCAVCCGT